MNTEIGKVIWFDRKKGFGFVKLIDTKSKLHGKDVFVHYSSINSESNFKVLLPGECISIDVEENTDESNDKEFNTSNVTGLFGTKLMVDNEDYILKVIRKKEYTSEEGGDGSAPSNVTE